MKKTLGVAVTLTLILIIILVSAQYQAYAYEENEEQKEEVIIIERENENINVNVTINMPEQEPEQQQQELEKEQENEHEKETSSSTQETNTVTAVNMNEVETTRKEPSGLEAVITELFGEYNPIIYHTTGTKEESIIIYNQETSEYEEIKIEQEVAEIQIGFNWTWLTGIVMFTIVLYSFFRSIGGLLKWK